MSDNIDSVTSQSKIQHKTSVSQEQQKTFTKNLSFCAHLKGSNVARIDTQNNKIIRIRPLHYNEKYQPEEFKPWKLEAKGKTFNPLMKEPLSPFALSYKKRVYSPNRIKYPLLRMW